MGKEWQKRKEKGTCVEGDKRGKEGKKREKKGNRDEKKSKEIKEK